MNFTPNIIYSHNENTKKMLKTSVRFKKWNNLNNENPQLPLSGLRRIGDNRKHH